MDLQGKPAYQDDNCPECRELKPGDCNACGKKIPTYYTMGGASPVATEGGFKSPEVHHWHLRQEGGATMYDAISQTLCREDYHKVYTEKYPDRKLKLDELPRELQFK